MIRGRIEMVLESIRRSFGVQRMGNNSFYIEVPRRRNFLVVFSREEPLFEEKEKNTKLEPKTKSDLD
jgi:hypothetical protein